MISTEVTNLTDKKCEFLNFTTDYVQGPGEAECKETATYLLDFGDGARMWACEAHKDEQEARL